MSRAVNAVVIGIAVFILLAGSFWYVSVAQGTKKLAVDSNLTFQSADESTTRLIGDITFKNRHDVDVKLTSFEYEFRVDSLSLAKNQSKEDLDLAAREERKESIVVSFPTEFVSEWLKNHVEAGEKSRVSFAGSATFQLGSKNQTIEFEDKREFSSSVRSSLGKAENCPRPSPQPCVESATATWREREKTRVLELTLNVKSTTEDDVRIDHPKAALQWSGIEVAKAAASGVLLSGQGTEPLEFALFIEHAKLKQWWPKHLESCEKSLVALSVEFSYEVQPRDDETTTPSPTTVSSAPTFTPPNSTSASPTNTSEPTPTSTTSEPASPTTTSTSATATSEPTSTTDGTRTAASALHQTTYVFLLNDLADAQEDAADLRSATWDFEGDDLRTGFVCEDPDSLLDLP